MSDAKLPSLIPVTDEQAKAIQAVAGFGTTVVRESGQLARYFARILGTIPEDAAGLVIGDPLSAVRTLTAAWYNEHVFAILRRRNVDKPSPVSPSLAIPLLKAAYDENRPDLREFWADLIAAAMDPLRSGRVRFRFIATLKEMDPIDALILRERYNNPGELSPDVTQYMSNRFRRARDEIEISADNLVRLACFCFPSSNRINFSMTAYGRELVAVCSG
jgi:hypothetical protein